MVKFWSSLVLSLFLFLGAGSLATAQENATWDAIQERDSIRLGVAPSDPWYFKDPMTNGWDGLGVRLGEALADDLGVELELIETTYGNAASALQADRIDVMFVLDATPERAESIDFLDAPLFYYSLRRAARRQHRGHDLGRSEQSRHQLRCHSGHVYRQLLNRPAAGRKH